MKLLNPLNVASSKLTSRGVKFTGGHDPRSDRAGAALGCRGQISGDRAVRSGHESNFSRPANFAPLPITGRGARVRRGALAWTMMVAIHLPLPSTALSSGFCTPTTHLSLLP